MIAAALGGKSADAGRARTAVGGHVVVEYGRLADELAALGPHIDVLPGAIDEKSHQYLRISGCVS